MSTDPVDMQSGPREAGLRIRARRGRDRCVYVLVVAVVLHLAGSIIAVVGPRR